MNERVAQVGNQVKDAFTKLKDAWKNQEADRKKRIIKIALIVLAVVIGIVIIISMLSGRYVKLYSGMTSDEIAKAATTLQSAAIPFRRDDDGSVSVPSRYESQAIMQLASVGVPSAALTYDTFGKASGLLVSETERNKLAQYQDQDRLQAIIKSGTDGVKQAFVTIYQPDSASWVWDSAAQKSSASVKVDLQPGYVLTPSQIEGIRYLVSGATGIEYSNITITDSNNSILAAVGQESILEGGSGASAKFKERQKIEEEIIAKLHERAEKMLYKLYSGDSSKYAVQANVDVNYDELIREVKKYYPMEGTSHGVINWEEYRALLGVGQYAEGIVGEDQNTDVTYADLDGDGEMDYVDVDRAREYSVDYVLEQSTKDGPEVMKSSMTVVVNDTLSDATALDYRSAVCYATGIAEENIFIIQAAVPDIVEPGKVTSTIIQNIPDIFVYGAIGLFVLLVFILILVIILRSKAKKKRLALEQAAAMEALEEQERVQMEIEQRKMQLRNAALTETTEDAIINEVRDFARSNPDITANLLRNWLKESDN